MALSQENINVDRDDVRQYYGRFGEREWQRL